jgi:RNA polymerase sigma factor (sigma-70 family)
MVLRLCRRMGGGDADAADDAAQQVFLALAARAGVLQSRHSMAGWLYRTAWHVATRQRRECSVRAKYERQAAAYLEREQSAASSANADSVPFAVVTSELNEALERAMGTLPENYRDALVLHHFGGHTVEQTAQLLGVPTGTAAAWLSRGRGLLRLKLENLGLVLSVDGVAAWLAVSTAEATSDTTPTFAMGEFEGAVCGRLPAVFAANLAKAGTTTGLVAGAACAATARGAGTYAIGPFLTAPAMFMGFSSSAAKAATIAVATSAVAVGGTVYVTTPPPPATSVTDHQKRADKVDPPPPKDRPLFGTSEEHRSSSTSIPEPTSAAALLGVAGVCLGRRRRRGRD